MKQLQVLVATMHQSDFSLVEKMNITCDAILANQTEYNAVSEQVYPFGTVRMISTDTRGVGINRNTALDAAEAEFEYTFRPLRRQSLRNSVSSPAQ